MTKHCNILFMRKDKMNSTNMAMALWFIKQFNLHFWSARIILIVVNLSEVTRNILFNIQNLVFWKPMVNTLLYVKYSLGPGDKTISETCCQLAQTKINLTNKYKFMNRWPTEQEMLIWLGLRISVGKNLPTFSSKHSAYYGIPTFKFTYLY